MTTTVPNEDRKRGPRIRGVCADAAALGVTAEHLALVLRGKRQSESLRARYQALKQSQLIERMDNTRKPNSPAKIPMPIELAALQNLQPSFFQILRTLGLEVVIVRFKANKDSAVWYHSTIATDLENELVSLRAAGEPVSSFFPLGAQWHFYHVNRSKLGVAIRRIKECLAARELLDVSQIFHAESAEILREWHPATAAESDAGTAMAYAWDGDILALKHP